ncbi:MAG: hypothetical protein ACI9UT_003016 [Flavobacteriales bacterium]|jgi:hypothetical protein
MKDSKRPNCPTNNAELKQMFLGEQNEKIVIDHVKANSLNEQFFIFRTITENRQQSIVLFIFKHTCHVYPVSLLSDSSLIQKKTGWQYFTCVFLIN